VCESQSNNNTKYAESNHLQLLKTNKQSYHREYLVISCSNNKQGHYSLHTHTHTHTYNSYSHLIMSSKQLLLHSWESLLAQIP